MKTDLRSHSGARRILSSSWSILIGAGRRVDAALDHYFWAWAIALTVLLLACSIVVDLRQKMWVDELYTLTMAQQPSAAEIIRATWEGCDGMPPLYAIVVHFILPWIRSEELRDSLASHDRLWCYVPLPRGVLQAENASLLCNDCGADRVLFGPALLE